jgi:lipopolysaccharide/colanic/teichoic acid biosynthesis glycosyltransferase
MLKALVEHWPSVSPHRFDESFEAPAVALQRVLKAAVDRTAAAAALGALSPLLAAVAIAIRVDSAGHVLFWQDRVGKNGDVFRICKFRTMRAPEPTDLSEDDRVTKLGKFLRVSSIDELPQLWNVLRGDMSLVGPRPFLPQSYVHFDERLRRTFRLRPGITGWAQVGDGRNAQSWDEKFARNLYYVENFSLLLDAQILVKTVDVVLGRKGVGAAPGSTVGATYQPADAP